MAIISLAWTSTISNTGFTNPDNVASSDDNRATGAVAGSQLVIAIEDAPADYDDTNSGNQIQLRYEARVVGTVNRAKFVTLTLTDAAGTPIQDSGAANITFSGGTLATSDRVDTSTAFTLADNYTAANINAWRIQADVTEGGGMPDTATVEIDHIILLNLNYDVIPEPPFPPLYSHRSLVFIPGV